MEITIRQQQIKSNTLWAADRNDAEDPGKAGWIYERKLITGKRSYRVILSILNVFAVNKSKTLKGCSLVLIPTQQVCFNSRTRNPYQDVGTDLFMGKMLVTKFLLCSLLFWNHLTFHGNITHIQA